MHLPQSSDTLQDSRKFLPDFISHRVKFHCEVSQNFYLWPHWIDGFFQTGCCISVVVTVKLKGCQPDLHISHQAICWTLLSFKSRTKPSKYQQLLISSYNAGPEHTTWWLVWAVSRSWPCPAGSLLCPWLAYPPTCPALTHASGQVREKIKSLLKRKCIPESETRP